MQIKKTSKLCVTGLCEGNSLVPSEVPMQRASNVENVSIWWCQHDWRLMTMYVSVNWVIIGYQMAYHLTSAKPLPETMLTYHTKLLGGWLIIRSCWGVYWFHSIRPSVCPSVHPSRILCPLWSAYGSGWIHFIFIHLIKQLQKVC